MALTDQKQRYADARLAGLGKKAAAIEAGCPDKTASQAASRYEKDPDVMAAMGRTLKVQESLVNDLNADPDPYIPAQSDDPKTFLTNMMNDLEAEPRFRLDAAKALMPYIHAKQGEKGKKELVQENAEKVSNGRFGLRVVK